ICPQRQSARAYALLAEHSKATPFSIAVHIHSEITDSIWQTLVATHKLGPNQLPKGFKADDLLWLTANSLKLRARTALFQVHLKD
ncbi:hypothetical protein BGZ73_001355, partial [Actinomortierella ambigua]